MRIVLVLLCLLVATSTLAVPVDPDSPNEIAAVFSSGANLWVLRTNGDVWTVAGSGWLLVGNGLPVPIEDVAEWYVEFLITDDGSVWAGNLNSPPDPNNWHLMPSLPWSPVSNQNTDLDDLKSMFR